jgi:hypothetical protein
MMVDLDTQKLDGTSVVEKIVRVNFNPSNSGIVNRIKITTAILINYCEDLKKCDPRTAAIAITHLETACMFAVKAATMVNESAVEEGKQS